MRERLAEKARKHAVECQELAKEVETLSQKLTESSASVQQAKAQVAEMMYSGSSEMMRVYDSEISKAYGNPSALAEVKRRIVEELIVTGIPKDLTQSFADKYVSQKMKDLERRI